ncbi:hypothetical protein V7793_14240 [Streptomyces sp. KLMMK]|uniref:hypothetical protein n=1 Tax=Streptomyces sp. KLMMK TaxID=3109353 RepID=UPI003009EA51
MYEDTRRYLCTELGHLPPAEGAPGAEFAALHQRILRSDPTLRLPTAQCSSPCPASRAGRPGRGRGGPRPSGGDFRANMTAGGTVLATDLDENDLRIAERIGPSLRADGLYLAGIDVIGGRLTEVNVTGMAGPPQLDDLTGERHDLRIVQWPEDRSEHLQKGRSARS